MLNIELVIDGKETMGCTHIKVVVQNGINVGDLCKLVGANKIMLQKGCYCTLERGEVEYKNIPDKRRVNEGERFNLLREFNQDKVDKLQRR